ncbi:MAG: ATP-binding protein, partial [Smithellaceae bacterium]|nr:ATP-binding protein [Smithellaceae bacterium]
MKALSQNLCESEITRLAHKMKWPILENYKKHVKAESGFEENLLTLLRLEDEQRDKALVRRRIKQAGFPITKTLDTFEFNQTMLPHLKQEQVLELALCDFIRKRTNVVAIGNSGTG